MLAGGLGPANVRSAIDAVAPVGGRLRALDRERARREGPRRRARVGGGGAVTATFGAYGGRYVPETLIPALDELEAGWARCARRRLLPRRAPRAAHDLRRPADAAHACRAVRARQAPLPEARGPAPHRRAQAQQRARPGRARAAPRQAADRRRDRRRPARRRDRHRLRAVRPRLRRLHGLRGHAPPGAERRADEAARRRGAAGRVRHEDAEGGDERGDPRLDHERRDDLLPDRLVRRPGAVPRARPRPAARDRRRGARAAARRRGPAARRSWSRASAAARTRSAPSTPSSTTPRAARRRRGGRRGEPRHGTQRRPPRRALVDPRRRRRPDRRRALDLGRARLPRRRARARALRDSGRAEYLPCTDDEALVAFHRLARPRGSSPRSRARTRSPARSTSTTSSCSSASPAAATRTSPRCSRRTAPVDEKAPRHLPGGEPETPELADGGRGRRRHRRARVPVLRSARRRADDPACGRARARRGDADRAVPRVHRATRELRRRAADPDDLRRDPRGLRLRPLRRRHARRRRDDAIVVDLPVEEHPEVRRVQLVAPTSTDERIRLAAAAPTAGSTSSR